MKKSTLKTASIKLLIFALLTVGLLVSGCTDNGGDELPGPFAYKIGPFLSSDGLPVPNAEVTVSVATRATGGPYSATTDADGYAIFAEVIAAGHQARRNSFKELDAVIGSFNSLGACDTESYWLIIDSVDPLVKEIEDAQTDG